MAYISKHVYNPHPINVSLRMLIDCSKVMYILSETEYLVYYYKYSCDILIKSEL